MHSDWPKDAYSSCFMRAHSMHAQIFKHFCNEQKLKLALKSLFYFIKEIENLSCAMFWSAPTCYKSAHCTHAHFLFLQYTTVFHNNKLKIPVREQCEGSLQLYNNIWYRCRILPNAPYYRDVHHLPEQLLFRSGYPICAFDILAKMSQWLVKEGVSGGSRR